jgi:hypothetical protein
VGRAGGARPPGLTRPWRHRQTDRDWKAAKTSNPRCWPLWTLKLGVRRKLSLLWDPLLPKQFTNGPLGKAPLLEGRSVPLHNGPRQGPPVPRVNKDPMYGCPIGTKYPIVHVKQDQAHPIHFSRVLAAAWLAVQVMRMGPTVTALSLSPRSDMLATTHVGLRGVYLWANQLVFGSGMHVLPGEEAVDVLLPVVGAGQTDRQAAEGATGSDGAAVLGALDTVRVPVERRIRLDA